MTDDDQTRREGPVSERTFASEEASAAVKAEYLSRGTLVGRYVILDVIGEGGMGVVYSAFDPELDRKVAIKLLQTQAGGSTSGGDRAWLVREAQALARLSHPNVVAVYDVGTLAGDRVFVAMELVEGETLRDWMKISRTWRESLPLLVAAGHGLAAAHAAGLVHRDFKPDNVIVGTDRRVRVMDFGLARLGTDRSDPDDDDAAPGRRRDLERSPLSEKLTIAGVVVGTPAYMAPEIYRGEDADARTDQFAFGVALYEALFKVRPYDKKDLQPPVSAPKPKTPPNVGVPAAIQNAVMRAISIDHDQRFPSMDALLAELRWDPGARRRRVLVGLGALAAAAALAVGVFGVATRSTAKPVPCKGASGRLAGVWDAKAKAEVKKAFDGTKRSFAAVAYAAVDRAMDQYTDAWTQAVTEACEATRVRGEQTEDVLSLRQACLDQHLEEVRVLAGLLAQADAAMVEKGDKIVFGLEPLAQCANIMALRAPGLPAPEIRVQVSALSLKIAEARADLVAGLTMPALVASQACIDGAKKIGYPPLVAEARIVHGATLLTSGSFDAAAADFSEAVYAAIRGKRDDLAADAGVSMALVASDAGGKPAEGKIWLDHADAAAVRIGADHALERRRLEAAGIIAAETGDFNTAIAMHEKMLAAAEAALGKDAPEMFAHEIELGTTYSRAGAYANAAPHFERAMALRVRSVGLDHPDIALVLSNLGAAYTHMHEPAKARAAFEKALAIRERYYGKNSPLIVATLDNFGEFLRKEGDIPAALVNQERALALCKLLPGTAHPMYHQLATDYADTLIAAKRFPDAHKQFDAIFALEEPTKSPIIPATQTSRAELAVAEARWTEAAAYADKAIAGYEASGGADSPLLWRPLTALARAEIGDKKPKAARPLLERALEIAKKAQTPDDDIGPTRDLLAHLPP